MKDRISKDKILKYKNLTDKALDIVTKSIAKGKQIYAKQIIDMVEDYLSDAEYFFKKGDFVNSFAALNYAHGWLDAGVRLGVFDVKDDKLFTIK